MAEEWRVVPLAELADLRIGATPARIEPSYWADGQSGLPWVAISDIQGKFLSVTSETITPYGARAARMRLVTPGTAIMSFKLSLGRATIPTVPVYTNEAIVALNPKPDRSAARWLYHAVPAVAKKAVTETAVKGQTLNLEKLRGLPILTPPTLGEQLFIAEILDEVDERIGTAERLRAKSDLLADGLSSRLLTPDSAWTECSIGDLGNVVTGATPSSEDFVFDAAGLPFITPAEVDTRGEVKGGDRYVRLPAAGMRPLPAGTTLTVCIGFGTGKAGFLRTRGCTNQQINAVVPSPDHDQRFVFMAIAAQAAKIRARANLQVTPIINKSEFSRIRVMVPRIDDQRRIADQHQAALHAVKAVDDEIAKLRAMRNAVTEDLLTGRVRVPIEYKG